MPASSNGSRMVNVLPWPGALSSRISPRCAPTMWRAIARPMPVPLTRRVAAGAAADESVEDRPLLGSRDADSPVPHTDGEPSSADDRLDPHRTAVRRVLDGVVEQVANRQAERVAIRTDNAGAAVLPVASIRKPCAAAVSSNSATTSPPGQRRPGARNGTAWRPPRCARSRGATRPAAAAARSRATGCRTTAVWPRSVGTRPWRAFPRAAGWT